LADKIINVVTVTVTVAAPDRSAAAAVARAVVSDALKRRARSSSHAAQGAAALF